MENSKRMNSFVLRSVDLFRRPRGPLPKVEEAFTLPIPVELTAKQQQITTASSTGTTLSTPTSATIPNSQYPSTSDGPNFLSTSHSSSSSTLPRKSFFDQSFSMFIFCNI